MKQDQCRRVTVFLLGSIRSGRTQLINRFICNRFLTPYITRKVNQNYGRLYSLQNQSLIITLYRLIQRQKLFYSPKGYCMRVCQADIIFITADLSDSLSKARQIVKESSKRKHRFKGSMILLGTKSDIKTYQPQYFEILSEIIQRFDIPYFEVSAKYDENVKEAFEFGFSKFLQKQNEKKCQNGKQQKAQDDNQF